MKKQNKENYPITYLRTVFSPYLEIFKDLYNEDVANRLKKCLKSIKQNELESLVEKIDEFIIELSKDKSYRLHAIVFAQYYFNYQQNIYKLISEKINETLHLKRSVKQVMDMKLESVNKLRTKQGGIIKKRLENIIIKYNDPHKRFLKEKRYYPEIFLPKIV